MKHLFLNGLRRSAPVAALAACLAGGTMPVHAEDGISSNEIVIGTTNALTGPIAVCGAVTAGANAYFRKVNDAGGIHGRKIRYEVLDDGYSTQRAIGNVRRLLSQEKVFALVSGCGTATGAAVLSAIEREPVPYLFPFVGLDALSQPPRKNVFSLLPLYGNQLTTILDRAVEGRDVKTAAISMITIAGHDKWLEALRGKLGAMKIKIVDEQLIDVTAADKSPFVTAMKSRSPDMVVMVDSSPGAARYLLEMQRQNWKPKVITGISTMSDESFLRAIANAGDGIVVAPGVLVPPTDPKAKECVDALAASDKTVEPSSYTMFGCLGAKVFVDAMQKLGKEPTRKALVSLLETTKGLDTGVSASITFAPDRRQGLDAIYPVGIENGKFKVLGGPLKLQ